MGVTIYRSYNTYRSYFTHYIPKLSLQISPTPTLTFILTHTHYSLSPHSNLLTTTITTTTEPQPSPPPHQAPPPLPPIPTESPDHCNLHHHHYKQIWFNHEHHLNHHHQRDASEEHGPKKKVKEVGESSTQVMILSHYFLCKFIGKNPPSPPAIKTLIRFLGCRGNETFFRFLRRGNETDLCFLGGGNEKEFCLHNRFEFQFSNFCYALLFSLLCVFFVILEFCYMFFLISNV